MAYIDTSIPGTQRTLQQFRLMFVYELRARVMHEVDVLIVLFVLSSLVYY